jgi:hypothetical protein
MSGMKSGYVLDYQELTDNIDNYSIEFHEKSDEDVL